MHIFGNLADLTSKTPIQQRQAQFLSKTSIKNEISPDFSTPINVRAPIRRNDDVSCSKTIENVTPKRFVVSRFYCKMFCSILRYYRQRKQFNRSRRLYGLVHAEGRPHASWLRQVESYLKDTGMTGLASAWAMARRRPKEYRRKVDAATRCSGVCPHT